MIRSKIDPNQVKNLVWKDYAKLFEKDIKQAQDKGLDKVPLIMISDFTFACGATHALILLGKQSEMNKFYKSLKTDEERKKLKDYSIGFCHFDKEDNGSSSMRIAIEGFGKPNKMLKNSKKLIKKLGLNLKELIKGQYTDEVVQDIEAEVLNEEQLEQQKVMEEQATSMKQNDDLANDDQKLPAIAKEFVAANKAMTTHVITLLKAAKSDVVTYTENHIDMAEDAFRAAASLVDKYQELLDQGVDLANSAKKITGLYESVTKNNLVKKYETIWKKVQMEYDKQMDTLEEPFKDKLAQLQKLLKEIEEEEDTKK